MQNISKGTTQDNLSLDKLLTFEFDIPDITIQQKVANILSSCDILVENNRRRIQLLEEMARALYREWFVHFRFPGYEDVEMVDSELGEIPAGWEIHLVKNLLRRLNKGEVYIEKDVSIEGKVQVVDQSRNRILGFHDNSPDFGPTERDPLAIFGDHTCKFQLMTTSFSVGPNVIPFKAKVEYPLYYVYSVVEGLVETKEYKRHWNELIAKKVVLATLNLAQKFAEIVQPMYRMISFLEEINRRTQSIRDLLLPRLVSGKLDVSELKIEIPTNAHQTSKYSN